MSTAHWALSATLGFDTLTRFTDPNNNSDKFRRFIAIADPSNAMNKILITQTGRWTPQTARGDWRGGSYKFQKESTFGWERSASLVDFLERNVAKKKGTYGIAHIENRCLEASEIRLAVNKCKEGPWLGGATPTAVAAVQQSSPAVAPASLAAKTAWLIEKAGDPSFSQFDLLPEYAVAKGLFDQLERAYIDTRDQLSTALNLIMLKEF